MTHRIRSWILLLAPISLIVAFAQAGCGGSANSDNTEAEYLNWSPEATYVGRDACQKCHEENYASFVQTQMGRSWKRATKSNSDANFDDPGPVFAPIQNLYYQPFAVGEDLFVREYRLAGRDTVHNRVEKIAWIVGSGQHTNSHIRDSNGFLYQVPLTWYVQDGRWDLPPGFASDNKRFDRPIPAECMTCHNGISPHVVGSENRFTSVASGIGCEKCHGPGSVHVEAINAGIVVDINSEIDYTIVHPGKLSPERTWDVCSRCHMQGVDVFRPGVHPDDFRPGKSLADYQDVFWPRQPDSVEVFNMASHPDRLAMSKCFREGPEGGRGVPELTCITCHNPHLDVKAKSAFEYNAPCRACHALPELPRCSEDQAKRDLIADDCSSCHMPSSGTLDIPHVRITDHYIRVPEQVDSTESSLEDRRRIIRMASLIDGDPTETEIGLAYLNYFERITDRPEALALAEDALRRARETGRSVELQIAQIWLWYLQKDYAPIRGYATERADIEEWETLERDAWTQMRIGEAFRASGEWGRAVEFMERAVELAPEQLRFLDRLGTTYGASGELALAVSTFDRILAATPTSTDALTNRGFAYLSQGMLAEAEQDLQRAIDLDPDAEVALGNLASIFLNTNRKPQARSLILRLMVLEPTNQNYIRFWEAAQ